MRLSENRQSRTACEIVGKPTIAHRGASLRMHLCWRIVEHLRVVVSESVQWNGKGTALNINTQEHPRQVRRQELLTSASSVEPHCAHIERGASLRHCANAPLLSENRQSHTACNVVGVPTVLHTSANRQSHTACKTVGMEANPADFLFT